MSKIRNVKKIVVLGAVGVSMVGGLASCTNALKEAQTNIDDKVVTVMNDNDVVKSKINGEIEKFTFLSADTTKENENAYVIDINGIATEKDSQKKAYTTLNYSVDGTYFKDMEYASDSSVINALAKIVENEDYNSISVNKVNDIEQLNKAMSTALKSPDDDFEVFKNFLYGIGNVEYNDAKREVSFTAKDTTRFSKSSVKPYIGKDNNTVYRKKREYKTYFTDQRVCVKLNREDYEKSKTDESIVFDKFIEFVNDKKKDNFSVELESSIKDKDFSANMMGEIALGDA